MRDIAERLEGVRDLGNRSFSLWNDIRMLEAGDFAVCWCASMQVFEMSCRAPCNPLPLDTTQGERKRLADGPGFGLGNSF